MKQEETGVESADFEEQAQTLLKQTERAQMFEVGKDYVTRGGWRARIVWIGGKERRFPLLWVVHKPGDALESSPVPHWRGGEVFTQPSINDHPTYTQHPADLVGMLSTEATGRMPEKE